MRRLTRAAVALADLLGALRLAVGSKVPSRSQQRARRGREVQRDCRRLRCAFVVVVVVVVVDVVVVVVVL